MNKIVVGLIFGALLGALDRASAWFYPEVRNVIASIMVGSTIKGMLVGLLSGWFARNVNSTPWGLWPAPCSAWRLPLRWRQCPPRPGTTTWKLWRRVLWSAQSSGF
jgi:hypothetical protein